MWSEGREAGEGAARQKKVTLGRCEGFAVLGGEKHEEKASTGKAYKKQNLEREGNEDYRGRKET